MSANDVHVVPNGDLIAHDYIDCPCGPAQELIEGADGDAYLYTHHSLDGREFTEDPQSSDESAG